MRLERTGQEQGGTAEKPESVKLRPSPPDDEEDFIHRHKLIRPNKGDPYS